VRRAKELIADHLADLGGENHVSHAEHAIVRRAAVLIVELESMEKQFALAGQATELQLKTYQMCANTLRRLLESVGLSRRARDVTPTLDQYLESKRVEASG
jgi:hypothetical protein